MKKINFVKFALDLLMGLTFVLLFNKQVLGGLTFHEIAGTVIGVAFLTHILLNWRWVKNITLQLFNRKLPAITRFGYILNVLLLISMTTIIVSGVCISRILFPNVDIGNEGWFKVTHIALSFVTLITVGMHIGLHWKWVMTVFKKIIPVAKSRVWLGYIAKAAALLILLFGLFEMNQTNFAQRIESSVSIFNFDSQSGMGGRPALEGEKEHAEEGQATENRGLPEESGDRQQGSQQGFEGRRGESANPFQVIVTYFGMMSVFVVMVYYLEKWWVSRRRKLKAG